MAPNYGGKWGFCCINCAILHFQDTYPEDLLSAVLSAVLKDTRVPPDQIGDICVGKSGSSGGVSITMITLIIWFTKRTVLSLPLTMREAAQNTSGIALIHVC